jgi:hypothetical protein
VDHFIVLGEAHLRRILRTYTRYYNNIRTHRSLDKDVNVRDGDAVKSIAAGLSVFRMGDDGKLTFARMYDIDVGDKMMFWMGMVPL